MRMMMRMVKVQGPNFKFHCYNCGRPTEHTAEHPAWADLDGPAFAAWYCAGCGPAFNAKVEV